MLKIGITGGIGSGKSTICRIFEVLRIPVYYADDRAKALLTENEAVVAKVNDAFGSHIYKADGSADRAALASIVFNNEPMLRMLEGILHPAVQEDFNTWATQQKAPYILKEAALLFESGSYKTLDKIIMVSAPEALRLARVVSRDNVTPEQVQARMNKQWSESKKIELSDFVIINDDEQLVLPQVLKLHREIIELKVEN